jgi:hypothetical protein
MSFTDLKRRWNKHHTGMKSLGRRGHGKMDKLRVWSPDTGDSMLSSGPYQFTGWEEDYHHHEHKNSNPLQQSQC